MNEVKQFNVLGVDIPVKDTVAREKATNNAKNISLLSNRKYLFIGDSYATGSGGGVSTTPWVEIVKQSLRLTTGDNYFVESKGGAGFGTTATGFNFADLLQNSVNKIDSQTRQSITDVVVGGGANDSNSNQTAIGNGVAKFMESARVNFPNARVHLFAMGWSTESDFRTRLIRTYYDYFRLSTNGFSLHEVYHILQNSNYMLADGIHPNDAGYSALGTAVANILRSGSSDKIVLPADVRIKTATGAGGVIGKAWVDDKNVYINFRQNTYPIPTLNIAAGTFIKIGEIIGYHLFGCKSQTEGSFMKEVVLTDTSNNVTKTRLRISMVRSTTGIDLYVTSLDTANNKFVGYNNIKSVSFMDEIITLPIWTA